MSGDLYAQLKSTAGFFLFPSNLLFVLLILSTVLLAFGRRRAALSGLSFAAAATALFGWMPFGELILAPLEARFPPVRIESAPPPFGLIVLGGAEVNATHARAMGTLMEFGEAGERAPIAALLARRFPDARIVISGGAGSPDPAAPSEAEGIRDILVASGVDTARIAFDRRALGTVAQVRGVLELIGPDRGEIWWVLTSAYHMPRSIGAFRKAGFDPVAFPTDFRRIPPFDPLYLFPRVSDGLRMTDIAAREWIGLLAFRLAGRTDEVFPRPRPAPP